MKRLLFFILTISFISCNTEKRLVIENKNLPGWEKLNVKALYKQNSQKNGSVKIDFHSDNGFANYVIYDSVKNRKIGIVGDRRGFTKWDLYLCDYSGGQVLCSVTSYFDGQGYLLKKGNEVSFSFTEKNASLEHYGGILFPTGLWNFYDRSGQILQQKNYEKDFEFNFTQICDYLNSINVELPSSKVIGNSIMLNNTKVERDTLNKTWKVSYYKKIQEYLYTTKFLNGKTGEVVKEGEYKKYYAN